MNDQPITPTQEQESTSAPSATKSTPNSYFNNPFVIAIEGIEALFNKAKYIGIALAVLSLISFAASFTPSGPAPTTDTTTTNGNDFTMASIGTEEIVLFGLVGAALAGFLFVIALVSIYISAITDYAAVAVARGRSVTLSEAAKAAGKKFLGYLWVQIIVAVKTFLWSLLLIVPGIYKGNRYVLAGMAYFDSDEYKGDKAVQRSQELVDGAWRTTFAGIGFFNVVTLGIASLVITAGSKITLFRQFTDIGDGEKPEAHFLSKLFTVLLVILCVFIVLAFLLFGFAVANYMNMPQ